MIFRLIIQYLATLEIIFKIHLKTLRKGTNIKNSKLKLLKNEKIATISNERFVIFIKYCKIIKIISHFLLINEFLV